VPHPEHYLLRTICRGIVEMHVEILLTLMANNWDHVKAAASLACAHRDLWTSCLKRRVSGRKSNCLKGYLEPLDRLLAFSPTAAPHLGALTGLIVTPGLVTDGSNSPFPEAQAIHDGLSHPRRRPLEETRAKTIPRM
jgi:hypothetical protein